MVLEAATQIAFAVGIFVLLFATYLVWSVLRLPAGSSRMQEIAAAIQQGAGAYLKRQYTTLIPFVVILAGLIWFFVGNMTAIAFIGGVFSSALAGYIGMTVSVRANVRTAQAAFDGIGPALRTASRGGAVTGMALTGLGLVGLSVVYGYTQDLSALIGFGFGASLISLFARVGGGIYTKAADVGADLVGKLEKGIPEDDPRNPAVIADNVGDNVGDCAGMAADLFESYVVTVIAAMLLGAAISPWLVALPLVIAAVGALAGVFGVFFIKLARGTNIMGALYKGVFATGAFALVGFWTIPMGLELFLASAVGVAATVAIFFITEYYTGKQFKPVKEIAEASKTGAATNLISGLAVGMESTALPALLIVAAIAIAFKLGGVYGIAIAAASMLSLTGIVITLDAYGPITDNAGGIAQMSKAPEKVRRVTDALDSVGNTTKATTKGFAIAGAALGALALFAAFAEATHLTSVNLLAPAVVIGLFIGALLPFVFSSFIMRAVGRAAFEIVE